MKKIPVLLMLLYGTWSKAQQTDYFITGKDTTYCGNLKYEMGIFLEKVSYTNNNGKRVTIEGNLAMPDISTFCISGECVDKVPIKPGRWRFYRYQPRKVDGKLRVYLQTGSTTSTDMFGDGRSNPVGKYRFFICMPDGTFYKINSKKNMEKYIKPYLLSCSVFAQQYKGNFSTREEPFMEMIRLYNALCKN